MSIEEMDEIKLDAKLLLTPERFDLIAKYIYAECYLQQRCLEWGRKVYSRHIEAFSGGNYSEPGDPNKNNLSDFIDAYNQTIESLREHGFDNTISRVLIKGRRCPTGSSGYYGVNGAHRIAASAVLNLLVDCDISLKNYPTYDYRFFRSQFLDQKYLDAIATRYAEVVDRNIQLFLIWPRAIENKELPEQIEKIFELSGTIIYEKKIMLSYNGYRNLLLQVYDNQPWIGSASNHFSGVTGKLDEIYCDNRPLIAYLVELKDDESVVAVKEKVRKVFGIGRSSCHSSDVREEMLQMVHLLYNDNSVDMLNKGRVDFDPETFCRVKKLCGDIKENALDSYDFVLDSSTALALYGLKRSKEISYLTICKTDFSSNAAVCNAWQKHLYSLSLEDIIYNPENYAWSLGCKVITPSVLNDYLKNRGEKQDLEDASLLKRLYISNSGNYRSKIISAKRLSRNIRTWFRDKMEANNIYVFTKLWHFIKGKGYK